VTDCPRMRASGEENAATVMLNKASPLRASQTMLAVVVMFRNQFTLLVVESCSGELRVALVIGSLRVALCIF
jgi:hypothetical protein